MFRAWSGSLSYFFVCLPGFCAFEVLDAISFENESVCEDLLPWSSPDVFSNWFRQEYGHIRCEDGMTALAHVQRLVAKASTPRVWRFDIHHCIARLLACRSLTLDVRPLDKFGTWLHRAEIRTRWASQYCSHGFTCSLLVSTFESSVESLSVEFG